MDPRILLLILTLLLGFPKNQNLNYQTPLNTQNQEQIQQFKQQQDNRQSDNNEGDFNITGGTSTVYYLKIILEGIEENRASSVPPQTMDGNLYCDDQFRQGIRARDVQSYDVTQITVPDDCYRPAVLLNIPHWLSVYVYLESTNRDNPQEVNFKGGDVNRDNKVNDIDLSKVLLTFGQNWSYSTSSSERPDLDLDGVVDNDDLNIIIKNFGAYGSVGPSNYSLNYSLIINPNDLRNNSTVSLQKLNINIKCNKGKKLSYLNNNYRLRKLIDITNLPSNCNQ